MHSADLGNQMLGDFKLKFTFFLLFPLHCAESPRAGGCAVPPVPSLTSAGWWCPCPGLAAVSVLNAGFCCAPLCGAFGCFLGEQWQFRALAVLRVLTDVFCAADWFNSHVRALDVLWQWLYKSWVLLQLFYVRASASDTLLGLSDRRKNPYCLCAGERCHWEKVMKAKSSSNCSN